MADYFIGEIRPFAFGFPTADWAFCNGQTLQIQQYPALAALLGTTFGGDGKSTFGLPNIQGRVLVGTGVMPTSGNNYAWGQTGGATTVTLTQTTMGPHTHEFNAVSAGGVSVAIGAETNTPGLAGKSFLSSFVAHNNQVPPGNIIGTFGYSHSSPATVNLATNTVSNAGTGGPHANMAPYVTINYCIAVANGEWPARN